MKRIEAKKSKIAKLMNELIDLHYEKMLKGAKRFEIAEVNMGTRKEPEMKTCKRMYWDEWFKDEDRPNERGVKVERSQLVEIDGKKSFGWNVIHYYKPQDITV